MNDPLKDSTPYVHSLLQSELGVRLPLHVSMSAPIALQTEQKAEFEESLRIAVEASRLRAFQVTVYGLDWVSNVECTRWFLVLLLDHPKSNELNKLLGISNTLMTRFGLQTLYADNRNEKRMNAGAYPSADREPEGIGDGFGPTDLGLHSSPSSFHISIAWTLSQPPGKGNKLSLDSDEPLQALMITFASLKLKMGNVVIDMPFPETEEAILHSK